MADLPQGMPYAIGPLSHLQSYWEPWESKCNLLPRGGPGFDGPVDASCFSMYTDLYMATDIENLRLNPMAKEFVPPGTFRKAPFPTGFHPMGPGSQMEMLQQHPVPSYPALPYFNQRKPDMHRIQTRSKRKTALQKRLEGNVRRTIYICDIDQQVTEAQLADLFKDSGKVVDCRVCGDPNSAMRFAFIEFAEDDAVQRAIKLNGTVLGLYPLRVMQSKTAIVPVNTEFLPRTQEERELCARTVYVANIDKKVDKEDVRVFFQALCGPVTKIRLLCDYNHVSSIAFVEFAKYDSAKAALDCSGALLGLLPIRVTPSKAPVRDES